ncbi:MULTISPECIES: hypothetical protein [unclassified Azospirillum]|uniref:hypothetical protein n=1 Tax=unclassified Azospirillum TaxID=2630922 RepID=UPI000B624A76|nr:MULTISPECIES: hypothetical protein [unclassified Azospirillum]SNT06220.1 hypothetical protein SAMN05880556_12146 [Azospirillum sp. RU38E]SNT21292.1 hypothetical protein SAMN05880591_12146 [Azospirillum sp. RU37A]
MPLTAPTTATPRRRNDTPPNTIPFPDTTEAWFWTMQAHKALLEGARVRAGQALLPRPCEPGDILKVVERLYRQGRLRHEHVQVLARYGQQMLAPERDRAREAADWFLWQEALGRMEPILRDKGIIL